MRKLMLTIAAIAGMVVGGGTAWADTEVFDGNNNKSGAGTSMSISANAITTASTMKYGTDEVLKITPDKDNNTVTFNVAAGYTISQISGVYASSETNASKLNTLNAVYVDGSTTSIIESPVSLPSRSAVPFEWSNLNAQSSIVLTFANYKQILLGFTVTYEATSSAETSYTVSISNAGAATLSLPTATAIPEGVTAYAGVLSADNSTLALKEIEGRVLPAGVPCVIYGEAGEYNFEQSAEEGVTPADNSLVANLEEGTLPTGTTNYVLNKVGDNLGFYQLAEGKTLGARKAYLPIATSAAAPAVRVVFGDQTGNVTGIQAITTEAAAEAPLYNLAGQKLQGRVAPGLYIQGGKKVWVK